MSFNVSFRRTTRLGRGRLRAESPAAKDEDEAGKRNAGAAGLIRLSLGPDEVHRSAIAKLELSKHK